MVLLGLDFLDPVFMLGSGIWAVAFPVGAALAGVVFRRLYR